MSANSESNSSKKTVGAQALELQKKDEKINPIDLEKEVHKTFEEELLDALQRGKKEFSGDFYLVVLLKKERLLQNVVRQYFFPRQSCPTPEYDQTVYKYHSSSDKIEYLWTVPDRQACGLLMMNQEHLTPEQHWMLQMVSDFVGGRLDAKARFLNKELVK